MKISLLEPIGVSKALIEELSAGLKAQGHEFFYYDTKTTDPKELIARSKGSQIVMIANNPYPAEVVEAADSLKMLDVAFTGIDHIGLDAVKRKGVMVCNAANYSNQTVAELVIGLTIGLMRKMVAADAATRAGGTAAGLMGTEISGRTVGIIGTGRIGLMTARLFKAFGAKLIGYSRSVSKEALELGLEYVSLEQLMEQSDIVSLHVPNNAATKGMIYADLIARMKKTALFINCARGPIVDNAALAKALEEGKIAGAGIDVYDMEPPIPADYPLLHAPNTILTPHVAFSSEESMIRRAKIVFQNLYAYLEGKPENVCEL